tara:strand:+ start:228 stop:1373 length:1146 start_codon:yes stop_codon:yes gene_type:complete
MQRSPLKQTGLMSEAEFQEIINYQPPSQFQQILNDPSAVDISKLTPEARMEYLQYGTLPVDETSPYFGRSGEGGGMIQDQTFVPQAPIPEMFGTQSPQSEGSGGMEIKPIPSLPVQQMPVEKKAFELNVGDVNVNTDSGQVDYKRDFSKSAFSNMSPAMVQGLIGGVSGIAQGLIGRAKRRREQRAAAAEYRARRAEFESLDTSNLAADIQNPFAENVFEDLTVNQQAARFANQQAAASRQNIMESLSGAAGGSGIAGLAQALANQATTAAQQASASIAQQEQRNEMLAAKGELQVQKGEAMTQQMQLAGAERARMLERRQTETLFGMAQQRRAAADQAIAQANAALIGGIGSIAGTVLTGGVSNLAQGLTFFGGGEMVKK